MIDAKPSAAGLKIAARKNVLVLPLCKRRGGACVKFIAIGRENQPLARIDLPGENEETQGYKRLRINGPGLRRPRAKW